MKLNKITIIVILLFMVVTSTQIFKFIKQRHESNTTSLINIVPNNVGIQTHIASAPVDVEAIKNNGFKIVRDDILWNRVERKPNEYDFRGTGYDDYNEKLVKNGIRPYHILSYSNSLYEKNNSVVTAKGREAYTKFVEQAASRYKNQNAIWEIWNEPNLETFWSPTFTSVEKYTELVKSASSAIRKNDPSGIVVAPAIAANDKYSLDWLEESFKKGLLDEIDAISVHFYRSTAPETMVNDFEAIKKLMAKYSKKNIPILSGEWGYSTGPAFYGVQLDQRQQAQYLVRMFLINMFQGIPINIWYDWQDHSQDLNNGEDNFGIRKWDGSIAKEASIAANTLSKTLSGYHFSKRIELDNKNDYILEFINKKDITYVYWTQAAGHEFFWPKDMKFKGQEISMFGKNTREVDTSNMSFWLSNSPTYLRVIK